MSEALRRIAEGATMIRTKGEPGTGDVVQAVSHMRLMQSEIHRLSSMAEDELLKQQSSYKHHTILLNLYMTIIICLL